MPSVANDFGAVPRGKIYTFPRIGERGVIAEEAQLATAMRFVQWVTAKIGWKKARARARRYGSKYLIFLSYFRIALSAENLMRP
ncbi:hypothetical protein [Cupriavidus necator]